MLKRAFNHLFTDENHLEALSNHLNGIYIEPVAGSIKPVFVCNWLVFVRNRLATGWIEPVIALLQADCRQKQADYRLNRACCKPITGSIEPVASRLQTKTSRLQACCNIYFFSVTNFFSVLKRKERF